MQSKRNYGDSTTRFGEFFSLWKILNCLWPFLEGLFIIWQNFEPALIVFYAFWRIYTVVNVQKFNQ